MLDELGRRLAETQKSENPSWDNRRMSGSNFCPSVLQEKVYHSKIADVDELKTRLIDEWAQFDQSIVIVDAPISQLRHRLKHR